MERQYTDEERREAFKRMRSALIGTTRKEKVKKISKSLYIPTGFLGGHAIAICISWSLNHSILWCLLHGVLGWLYIIYYVLTR